MQIRLHLPAPHPIKHQHLRSFYEIIEAVFTSPKP